MPSLRRCIVLSALVTSILSTRAIAAPRGPAEAELERRRAELGDGRDARAVLAILGAGTLDDLLLDGGEGLLGFLREASAAREPLVAAQARFELARRLERRGKREEAEATRAPLGLLDRGGLLIGPFASELGATLPTETALPPEPALLLGAIAPGARWPSGTPGSEAQVRNLPALGAGGVVALGALMRPEAKVAAYVVYALRSDRAVEAVVRLGTTGAHVVWLNGQRLGARTGDRSLSLDADGYLAPLRAGLNRLVVRVSVGERAPELLLRLVDRRGARLAGVELVEGEAARAAVEAGHGKLGPAPTLRSALDAAARRGGAAAIDRDAYVLLSGIDGPRPEATCGQVAAFATQPRSARQLELALACAIDPDARRRALEARLTLIDKARDGEAETIDTLAQLAELDLRGRTQQRGEERLRAATRVGAGVTAQSATIAAWRAVERLAQLDADRGLPSLALGKMQALAKQVTARQVREAAAQLAQRAGRREEALLAYRALVAELPGDIALLRQVAALERARGERADLEAALARLRAIPDVRDRESTGLERAEIEEGLGRIDRAEAELRALIALCPDEARFPERLGRLLLSAGRREEALAPLRAALAKKPQSPELRGLLAEIDGKAGQSGAELARRFGVDVAALRARAAHSELGRGDPARVLYDGRTLRVHENGLREAFVERLVEINDRRGAEQEGGTAIRYAPDSESVEVRIARVYKASGEIVEAAASAERDLSEPWAGLFYDVRAQEIRVPGLEPGDVVHVAYTIADHGRRNELGDSFGDLHMLQEGMARLRSVYRLIAPSGRVLYLNKPRLFGRELVPQMIDDAGERRYELAVDDVPKYRVEAGMPGETEVGAHVHVSTFASWADVARFYRGLALPQLEPDAEIRRAARAAVKGKTRVEDKVAAIYDLVVGSTRYVGLEFGVHGYQPYKVSQIWARRFGDCKDKASLLVAMLKEVGVDATLILLRTRREGAVDAMPASLAPFDHAIAYVPALRRYLDGTAELSGATELPAQDQGVAVLHVDDGRLRITPVAGADGARTDSALDVRLAADGSAQLVDRRMVTGQGAEAWRRWYQAKAQRRERLEKVWAQRSPGAIVREVELPHLDDRERPVELSATVELPRLARRETASLYSVPVLLREPGLLAGFARLSTREQALELPYAFSEHERVTLRLPRGARVLLPRGAEVAGRFGRFTLRLTPRQTPEGAVVDIEAETAIDVRRVAVADYPAFRAFLAEIDRATAGELRVELAP